MGPRILLADDSNVAQRMGKEILTAEGFDVSTVSNGQAALKKLHDFNPDLILADIFMPGTGGYELCAFVKADPQLSHVPVVLLVGAMEPYDPDEGRKAKADAVITKPLQSSSLLSTVKKLLQTWKPVTPVAQAKTAAAKPSAPPTLPTEEARAPAAPPPVEEPEAPAPAPVTEEPPPVFVFEEPLPVSFEQADSVVDVPPEMADQPMAALEQLLDTTTEPAQESHEEFPVVAEALSDTYAEQFAISTESATDEAATVEPTGDASPEFPFPFPSVSDAEESTEDAFPIAFPAEDMQPAEAPVQEFELVITDAGVGGESPTTTDDAAPEPELAALGFVSGSSTALEQTSADPGVLSIISEVSDAEPVPLRIEQPAEPEPVPLESVPAEQITWTVETAEVAEEDRSRFEQPSPDWGTLTQLAEEPEAEAPVAAALTGAAEMTVAEPTETAAEPPPEQQQAAPQFLEPQEVGTEQHATTDAAYIQKLVRESVEQMMPLIVDRIVRNVEIVLKREQD